VGSAVERQPLNARVGAWDIRGELRWTAVEGIELGRAHAARPLQGCSLVAVQPLPASQSFALHRIFLRLEGRGQSRGPSVYS